MITLDHKNSASTVSELLNFKIRTTTADLWSQSINIEVDGGTINNVLSNGTGYDFDLFQVVIPPLRIGLPAGSFLLGYLSREPSHNLF